MSKLSKHVFFAYLRSHLLSSQRPVDTQQSVQLIQCRSFRIMMPSFELGSARAFDLAGNLNRYVLFRDPKDSPQEVDAKAVASDWRVVEDHIASALSHFSGESIRAVDPDESIDAANVPSK